MHHSLTYAMAPRRLAMLVLLGVLGLMIASATPAVAVEPPHLLEEDSSPRPVVQPSTEPTPTSAPQPSRIPQPSPVPSPVPSPRPVREPAPTPAMGYDISYPQCGSEYPDNASFAVVGVNGGRVYSPNRCLGDGDDASQLAWAGRDADLYLNTGNPGPRLSRYWPNGQSEPRECDTDDSPGADTIDCAFVYGWNAAEDSYRTALDAFISLDWADDDAETVPGERTWWLDVEPANSWRFDSRLNVAALEGAVAYLESMEVDDIGFYSTPRQWGRITGGTDVFADYPAWHAGARDRDDAEDRCADEDAFTGGELHMVQWTERGFDANHRCET
ncbi:hypothetical protein BH23CHL9_BH23CHL9_14870 [soil metagenome]